jgi:hypothetical protein
MTFRQLCTLKKIERFERIVSENPSIIIEEAALKAGYNDASYFSRVYTKRRDPQRRRRSSSPPVRESREADKSALHDDAKNSMTTPRASPSQLQIKQIRTVLSWNFTHLARNKSPRRKQRL